MAICTRCQTDQPLTEFKARPSRPLGRYSQCRACDNARHASARKADPEAFRLANIAWRQANPEAAAAQSYRYFLRNRAARLEASRTQYEKTKDQRAVSLQKWRSDNPHKLCAYSAQHRAAKVRATTPWASEIAIEAIYERARLLSDITGVPHDVDHIIPLRGRMVRGLHVPANLRCIPATTNRQKSNSWVAA